MLIVGLAFVYKMQGKIDNMSVRLMVLEEKLEKLIEVLVQQGRHEERIASLDQRLLAQGIRFDDLSKRFNTLADAK